MGLLHRCVVATRLAGYDKVHVNFGENFGLLSQPVQPSALTEHPCTA